MKLLWSPRSPFVRKVDIVLDELGATQSVERVETSVALTAVPAPAVLAINPLGKIPALELEDGSKMYDSPLICEYLDVKFGPKLFPADLDQRIRTLKIQSLCDGLIDILLLWRTELGRKSCANSNITAGYETKVRMGFAALEEAMNPLSQSSFSIAEISAICLIGQLEFRWPKTNWHSAFPNLAERVGRLESRPSVKNNPSPNDPNASVAPFQFLED